MRFTQEPIHILPRMLPRRWGKQLTPAWCEAAARPPGSIGEIWLAHPNNMTREGRHLGELLGETPQSMLGNLGRTPPSLRLVLAEEPSDAIVSDGALSLWRMLEAPIDHTVSVQENAQRAPRQLRARRDDMFRVEPGVSLSFGGDVSALEVRANFTPFNVARAPRLQRVAGASDRAQRDAWLRDPALSVERWTLPELSVLEPDGETCHVLVALTPGVVLDGQKLGRGDAVFLPAQGRHCTLSGRGAQVLAAYPDLIPTEIWKVVHPPSPASLAIDPALLCDAGAARHAFYAQEAAFNRAAA